ncbi:MAG: hypothetical protein RSA27_08860 [Oscillospiraceae bacterium]
MEMEQEQEKENKLDVQKLFETLAKIIGNREGVKITVVSIEKKEEEKQEVVG